MAWVVLNRPEVRNAISFEMQAMIPGIMGELAKDGDVRVIVLTGAGDRAFSAGADVSEFKQKRSTAEQAAEHGRLVHAALQSIAECSKPVIAMINGFAVGNGYMLAMFCDLRIAADTAKVGITSSRLGLGGAGAEPSPVTELLVEMAGPAFAKEVLLTGRLFTAERAARMGLVNEAVPAAELEAHTRAVAQEIAANAPLSVMGAKASIDAAVQARAGRSRKRRRGAEAPEVTRDAQEGVEAFLAKRRPRFRGE